MRIGTIPLLAALLLSLCLAPVQAQIAHTPFEIAMLPDYCRARLGNDEQARQVWLKKMGQNWYHLHHYCSGLTAMQRASTEGNIGKRTQLLEFAIKEFNYVLKNWAPDFYLVKDAEMQRASASRRLGRPVH